ncbi:hypothetical protein LINPERHAP1_LOCUS33692 [Linum perenne]
MGQVFSASYVLAAATIFVAGTVGMKISALASSDFIRSSISFLLTKRPPAAPEDVAFVEQVPNVGYWGWKAKFGSPKLMAGGCCRDARSRR